MAGWEGGMENGQVFGHVSHDEDTSTKYNRQAELMRAVGLDALSEREKFLIEKAVQRAKRELVEELLRLGYLY